MLKALELVGFKSFADKTRFEFPPGITAVVGPNGSGKSNVVDAIKWVLGEQSVKSLRGKEMADVIFNGSGGRHPLNAAEATLTLDNSRRSLPIDAPEVHITRRVYRSGEGEYLINRQPCRLRDIREVFFGTGVATDAYSVIEQGKVDILLQASPRDRRAIFEEAAGISRFKLKKIESLRRLERVEQNLLRLGDIIEEVENRLRSVRLQASKARRYKEHADRLQELRTQVGLADWRKLGDKLEAIEAEVESLAHQRDSAVAEAERIEAQALALENSVGDTTEAIRATEAQLAQIRERIATQESLMEHERARLRDTEEETSRHLRQMAAMRARAGDLEHQLQQTATAAAAAEEEHRRLARQLAADEQALADLTVAGESLRAEMESCRTAYFEAMRALAASGNEASALESQVEAARAMRERSQERLGQLDLSRQALAGDLAQLRLRQEELVAWAEERGSQCLRARSRLAELSKQHAGRLAESSQWHQRHTGATERATVLEELERHQEGLGAGVKEVLARARSAGDGPFRQVRGLVADLLQASMEMAPLIEVALGEKAQHFVVGPDEELLSLLTRKSYHFAGRVGFLRLQRGAAVDRRHEPDLAGRSGVVGRACQFVEVAPPLAPLAGRLLGRTWIVETLSHALGLSEGVGRGLDFVTLAGELLTADGTILVGPHHASTGLISRRSELGVLKRQIVEFENQIAKTAAVISELERQIAAGDEQVQSLAAEHERAVDAVGEQRLREKAAEERHTQWGEQRAALEAELAGAEAQWEQAAQALAGTRHRLQEAQSRVAELEAASATASGRAAQFEERRQHWQREATAAKVQLAKSEERLSNLRARQRQFELDQQERRRLIVDSRSQWAQGQDRSRQSQANILAAESQVAELYLGKEALAAQIIALVNRREAERQTRAALVAQAQRVRAAAGQLEQRRHAQELTAHEIRHERTTLSDRLRDDYGIEIAEWEHVASPENERERGQIDQEIAELRRKINSIGNVNLQALEELEQLEARSSSLTAQHDDLSKAKASLFQIIAKINADSRRLFAETLEAVKGYFQALFRKLFGGGQADIVLEEGVDILDSGIEIVARPPGKEPRSISLLSGGEKTLTCVALLLAIFQYRPSPFCVLDEVDASLDEANIERFIGVLEEFLAWTQFIMVTHSKKTMTCATTLYGITMQESGVSKRVSVRFEDVSDDGELRLPADQPGGDETQAA